MQLNAVHFWNIILTTQGIALGIIIHLNHYSLDQLHVKNTNINPFPNCFCSISKKYNHPFFLFKQN